MLVLVSGFVALLACSLIHSLGVAALALLATFRIDKIGLGIGPQLASVSMGSSRVVLHAIPLGSYVKFTAPVPNGPSAQITNFNPVHQLRQAGVGIGGCLAVCAMAVVCLGLGQAWGLFHSIYPSAILGGVIPGRSHEAISFVDDFLRAHTTTATLGFFATIYLVFQLLPIPGFRGGELLLDLAGLVKPLRESVRERLQLGGGCVALMLIAGWAFAVIRFAAGPTR